MLACGSKARSGLTMSHVGTRRPHTSRSLSVPAALLLEQVALLVGGLGQLEQRLAHLVVGVRDDLVEGVDDQAYANLSTAASTAGASLRQTVSNVLQVWRSRYRGENQEQACAPASQR